MRTCVIHRLSLFIFTQVVEDVMEALLQTKNSISAITQAA